MIWLKQLDLSLKYKYVYLEDLFVGGKAWEL